MSDLRRWTDDHAALRTHRNLLFVAPRMDDRQARQRDHLWVRPFRGEGGGSGSGGLRSVVARLMPTRWRTRRSPQPRIAPSQARQATVSRAGASGRSSKPINLQSTGLMEAYRGNQSRLPVLMEKPQTAPEDSSAQHAGGGGGSSGGGGDGDVVLTALQAMVGAAQEALTRARASGVGVATALAALAMAKLNLAQYSLRPAADQVCQRRKDHGQPVRPRAAPRLRRPRKGR